MVTLTSLLLLLLLAVAGGHSPSPSPIPPPSTADLRGGGPLDPHQLTALHSLGLPATSHLDPCSATAGDVTALCDAAAPYWHVTSLLLTNCSKDISISSAALAALATSLRSLSFSDCPAVPPRWLPPAQLAAGLRSFSCAASLRRLSAVWLSRLANLTDLAVADTPIASGSPTELAVVISQMRHLKNLTVSNANLSGVLPHHWHCANLTYLDLSKNRIRGSIPSTLTLLGSLRLLNLSSNLLAGEIPSSLGDLIALNSIDLWNNSLTGRIPTSVSTLSELAVLNLGSNRLNGSIPTFLSEIRGLKELNLENNDFHGVIPFNATFVSKLQLFKIAGNSNLCYNRTVLPSKLNLGIAPCDKYGYPVPPPPDRRARSDKSTDYSDDGGDGEGDGDGGGRSHGPNGLVLGVAIGLSCLAFLVILLVCLSKVCG